MNARKQWLLVVAVIGAVIAISAAVGRPHPTAAQEPPGYFPGAIYPPIAGTASNPLITTNPAFTTPGSGTQVEPHGLIPYPLNTPASGQAPPVINQPAARPSFEVPGQYCADAHGGQIFVPAGAPTENLQCPAPGPATSVTAPIAAVTPVAVATPAVSANTPSTTALLGQTVSPACLSGSLATFSVAIKNAELTSVADNVPSGKARWLILVGDITNTSSKPGTAFGILALQGDGGQFFTEASADVLPPTNYADLLGPYAAVPETATIQPGASARVLWVFQVTPNATNLQAVSDSAICGES